MSLLDWEIKMNIFFVFYHFFFVQAYIYRVKFFILILMIYMCDTRSRVEISKRTSLLDVTPYLYDNHSYVSVLVVSNKFSRSALLSARYSIIAR